MSKEPGQAILILGMHRSGTSYLARLMQAMGVFIGDDLVGPQKGNPRGHFEAVPLLEFHQNLIESRISGERRAFDDGMLVQKPISGAILPEERKAAEEIVHSMSRAGHWGWKEPRTCLFLSLWKELLPDSREVMVYRHPLEVHQSLLRREHWDLSLFPDQAMRAYCVYNEALLSHLGKEAFVFNANTGFSNPPALARELGEALGLQPDGDLPEFHAREFNMMPVSNALHALFGLVYPEAARIFDTLQEKSVMPYVFVERYDDPELERIYSAVKPLVEDLPAEGRAFLGPLVDWWSTGCKAEIFTLYGKLAEAIGGRVQRVEQWNREAAEIFKENERLQSEYERMGKEFASQQAFLAKQAATQEKVWNELSRTGKSWEEQRDMIQDLLSEKRALLEAVKQLREELDKSRNA